MSKILFVSFTGKNFETELEAAKEWIERTKVEVAVAELPSSDIKLLEKQVAKLREILAECQSPSNVVNGLVMKGETALQNGVKTNKQTFESRLVELKNSVEEIAEKSRVTIEKLEETMQMVSRCENSHAELKAWMETEEGSLEGVSVGGDVSSLEATLELFQAKLQQIELKEKEIKDLAEKVVKIPNTDTEGNQTVASQVIDLEMSCSELKRKVKDRLESLESDSVKVKEFETELQNCQKIVQEIENVVTNDVPFFANIECMESYVQELKSKFQKALAQRSVLFQLAEKKDQASFMADAERKHQETVDKWKTLLARFSAKIAEIERKLAEEKELSESLEEVSGWVENVERELALYWEPQELTEVAAQIEKFKVLNNECASHEKCLRSLRSKVEDSKTNAVEGNKDRVNSLETRVSAMQKDLLSKLEDAEQCVSCVNEAKARISSSNEWLLKNKDLISSKDQFHQVGNVQELKEKLEMVHKFDQVASIMLNEISQARGQVGECVGKVSSTLGESLCKELSSLCDTLRSVDEDSRAIGAEMERHLTEARELENEITRYEVLLKEAVSEVHRLEGKSESIGAVKAKLGETRDLKNHINIHKDEFLSFVETRKDFAQETGVKKRIDKITEDFEKIIQEIPRMINDFESKINECMQCNEELESAMDWLNKAAEVLNSDEAFSMDSSSNEQQLAKVKELKVHLESFESKLSALQQNGNFLYFVGDDAVSDLRGKLDSVRTNWKLMCDDASQKESALVSFLEAQRNYKECVAECKKALEDSEEVSEEKAGYSAVPEKYVPQLERWQKQLENCQELEEKIRAMEQAGDHMASMCEALREPLREEVNKIKDDCKSLSTEAVMKKRQLETWISETGKVREEMDVSLSRVRQILDSFQSAELRATDMPTANVVLGQLKQLESDLEAEKQNVEIVLDKGEMVLAKIHDSEKNEWKEALRALQTTFDEAREESRKKVRHAEERINDIIEFDKESARCESLLTIYQAAVPVDVSCTVETLGDQLSKLRRLYSDVESRESQMTALHEREERLSGDGSLDGKVGKLQEDWGKLKASLGEKLHDLERVSQTKETFEGDFNTCLGGVQELERALHESRGLEGPVDERIQTMNEMCATIKAYRDKLDQLTNLCQELPITAYEENDLDPRKRVSDVVKRWEELHKEALERMSELEGQKREMQHLVEEISSLQNWVQDVCTPHVNEPTPSFVKQKELEKALLDNTEFGSLLSAKCEWLSNLLPQTNKVSGDAQAREVLLKNLREISRSLEDAKIKTARKDSEIKSRLQQSASLTSDINRVKVLLEEAESSQSSEAVDFEDDCWIEDRIDSLRFELAKMESCEQLLASVSRQIDEYRAKERDAGQPAIARDVEELSTRVHTQREQLVQQISQLEELNDFASACSALLTFYESLRDKILVVDVDSIAQEADVVFTEGELAKCRAIDQSFSDKDGEFKALSEKELETLPFAPDDKKRQLEERCRQVHEKRNTLRELIHDRLENLRNLVAEQQTLEGWLKKAGLTIKEAGTILDEDKPTSTFDESWMLAQSQALEESITKLEDYITYSEGFRDSSRADKVQETNVELLELKKQLVSVQKELQQFQEEHEAFQTEATERRRFLDRCAAERCAPGSLQEAQEKLADVEVNDWSFFELIWPRFKSGYVCDALVS